MSTLTHPPTRLAVALLLTLLCTATSTLAAGPPERPLLRLETGGHTAMIRRIAADRAGRWLVSASDDKSLRVWDGADGRLLRTLRPPIGDGNDGKLFAVAMDPDGDWVAAGGWNKLGYQGAGNHNIFVFGRADGRLRRRITGLGNVINHLCVSPDGRRLGAVLGGGQGLRVYAADAGFGELFADRDYGERSLGCTFAADGRLVTSSFDGKLRLYAPDGRGLRRVATRSTDGGRRPYGVAFHPDDDRVAVGYEDSTVVEVLSGADLRPLYRADTSGIGNGSLDSVGWSADGAWLLAGGTYDDGRSNPVVAWKRAGRGRRDAWAAADNTVMSLAPLPGARIAVGTADPALLLLGAGGKPAWQRRPAIADLRDSLGDAFRVSVDGRRVGFGFAYGAGDPAWFDLDQRQLQRGRPPGGNDASGDPVKALQQALARQGYDPGPADGVAGPSTRRAAARFRRDRGLPTGRGDPMAGPGLARALGLSALYSPRTGSVGLRIDGWKHTTQPTLNGRPLKLKQYEIARSVAVSPDGRRVLLGTEWSLRLFDADGDQVWRKPVPGVAWGVNISADGRLAVAALGDGTIRWYRLRDGQELLALFPHQNPDGKGLDWVLWTPSGYYDASPGGDRLIGWQLNNGKDRAADFVPAGQLRERFYRPAVVAAVLDTLDEDQAIARAGIRRRTEVAAALPPTVELLDPVDGALFSRPELTLRYRANSRGGEPITRVQVLVDGRPLAGARGLGRVKPDGKTTATQLVVLPPRDLQLSLIAENRHGASPPASVQLVWGGGAQAEFRVKPKLYALVVGVADYRDDSLDLVYPAKDARDLAAVIRGQQGRLYRAVEVRLVTDGDGDAILDGLDWLRDQVTAKDLALLFMAGHGVNDKDGDYYFLPSDANTDRLRRTAVPYYEVKKTLSALPGKALAFIDTCHAGDIMGTRRGVADITAVVNDLAAAENGVVVFASSTGRQYSLESSRWGNGAFAKALVEGLDGKADYTGDGTITINQLDLYLSERVKELTGNRQTPTTTKPTTISDFPIAVVRSAYAR